jgi:hypothetical protein
LEGSHPRLARRRDAGTGDRRGAAGAASANGRAGHATRAARPADQAHFGPQDIEWCLVDDGFRPSPIMVDFDSLIRRDT